MIDFPAAVDDAVVRWPSPEARDWVIGFLRALDPSGDVLAIVAIGSAIRPRVESADLDLLALLRDGATFQARPPIEIDLRHYEVGRVADELESGNDLLTWAVRFGVTLYDPLGCWRSVWESWHDRLKLPDPATAEDRAKRAAEQLRWLQGVGDDSAANEVEVSYLTHLSRAELSRAGVFPASRPELAAQLRRIGSADLAQRLERVLDERARLADESAAV